MKTTGLIKTRLVSLAALILTVCLQLVGSVALGAGTDIAPTITDVPEFLNMNRPQDNPDCIVSFAIWGSDLTSPTYSGPSDVRFNGTILEEAKVKGPDHYAEGDRYWVEFPCRYVKEAGIVQFDILVKVDVAGNITQVPSNGVPLKIGLDSPKNVKAILDPENAFVSLAWKKNPNDPVDETGFEIERKYEGSSSFYHLGAVGKGVLSYKDESIQPGLTYTYRIRAWTVLEYSAYSKEAKAKPPQQGKCPRSHGFHEWKGFWSVKGPAEKMHFNVKPTTGYYDGMIYLPDKDLYLSLGGYAERREDGLYLSGFAEDKDEVNKGAFTFAMTDTRVFSKTAYTELQGQIQLNGESTPVDISAKLNRRGKADESILCMTAAAGKDVAEVGEEIAILVGLENLGHFPLPSGKIGLEMTLSGAVFSETVPDSPDRLKITGKTTHTLKALAGSLGPAKGAKSARAALGVAVKAGESARGNELTCTIRLIDKSPGDKRFPVQKLPERIVKITVAP